MLTKDGPKVLEFNCRLGDPETQAILARTDFNLAETLVNLATRRFQPTEWNWKPGASACIVVTSVGYPGKFSTGKVIQGLTGLRNETGVKILHAGTRRQGDNILTSGGRVLGITSVGPDLPTALSKAYAITSQISFDGMHYRTDIGAGTGRAFSAGE
jgi:phosphoribosylamine--glycine ligase